MRSRCSRRPATRSTASCGRAWRSPDGAGPAFAEDDTLSWHPSLAPLAELHGEGKVSVMPGIGYDHPNQSHFTSRHFWEVGAADERLTTGWLGRYLDRVGSKDNPLQGLSLDWSLQPSLATAKMPVAAVDAPDSYDFWARGVWGEVSERMVATIGRLGAIPTTARSRARGGSRRSAPVGPALRAAHPVPAEGRQEAAARPGGLPGERRRLPAPPRRPRGDARRRHAAARRRAVGSRRLRHARQPGGRSRRRPEADRRLAPRLPARPRGAWARRPRARARLDGVRPAGQGERLRRHRSRRRRHRLPDRLARRRDDDRRVPRPRAASTQTATSAPRPTSAGSTAP